MRQGCKTDCKSFAVTVSKKGAAGAARPSLEAPRESTLAMPCTRVAISFSPSGPWYTAYIAAMFASSACRPARTSALVVEQLSYSSPLIQRPRFQCKLILVR